MWIASILYVQTCGILQQQVPVEEMDKQLLYTGRDFFGYEPLRSKESYTKYLLAGEQIRIDYNFIADSSNFDVMITNQVMRTKDAFAAKIAFEAFGAGFHFAADGELTRVPVEGVYSYGDESSFEVIKKDELEIGVLFRCRKPHLFYALMLANSVPKDSSFWKEVIEKKIVFAEKYFEK